ncbi:MAG: nitrile hydratase accessory protein [Pseudomonadota bacterium]
MVADLKSLPGMVLDGGEPVFAEPWEAQAFAMTLHLYQQGLFTWEEWTQHLSAQIHGGKERVYYAHWLAALESVVAEKTAIDGAAMDQRQKAWEEAAERTPHGEPIELDDNVRGVSKTF